VSSTPGGSPRGSQAHRAGDRDRPPIARPASREASADRDLRDPHELRRLRDERQRGRVGGRSALGGLLRLGAFIAILAVLVLVVGATVLRPVATGAIVGWASDNPGALRLPFVADLVRQDLGAKLSDPASADPSQVTFEVQSGDSASTIAERLAQQGLLQDPRAFVITALDRGVEAKLEAGTFVLRRNMTPDQLVGSLLEAKDPAVTVMLREGLRLEQVTAKLETLPLSMDVQQFYRLAKDPPASFLAARPWLKIPAGASLEGFLAADTYQILRDTTAEEFLGMLVDHFHETVGDARMEVPASRGMSFYEVLSLASIAQQEAIVADELPLIAGVYQNRLDKDMLLQADPTVIYGNDTVQLAKLPVDQWVKYSFWEPIDGSLAKVKLPKSLAGYQTYQNKGLIPGPISTPTTAAIDAALNPDTQDGYLFFVAKGDGSNTHAFAKTYAQHLANLKKYGYQ
jgi:UPF0755 protein